MPDQTLTEKMEELFSTDEDIQEWKLLGKLPQEIADIAACAMQPPEGEFSMPIQTLGAHGEEITHVAQVIQREFFPDAPPLERGGFMKAAFGGGPAPDWLLWGQISGQIVREMTKRGYEVEINDPLADLRPENREPSDEEGV